MISLSHLSGLFLGVLLGFVMQRGRFCLAGGLRDLYLFRDSRMLIAILIVISVQSIGLFIFSYFGIAKSLEAHFLAGNSGRRITFWHGDGICRVLLNRCLLPGCGRIGRQHYSRRRFYYCQLVYPSVCRKTGLFSGYHTEAGFPDYHTITEYPAVYRDYCFGAADGFSGESSPE